MGLERELDHRLGAAVSAGDVPGVVALVTDRDGTLYEGAFGERVLGSGVAMTVDTVGWIASMTKALVSAAAMQLVERGVLALDAPAGDTVAAIGDAPVLTGFDGDGAPLVRPPVRPVTLRHLLTHTAGFGYEIFSADIQRVQAAWQLPGIIEGRNAALGTPLLFDPGERWEYGINTDWVGKMVEAASGKVLGDYLREFLFEPLGMNSTAFRIAPEMRARMAKLHQRGEDGQLAPIDLEMPQDPEFQAGGGGLYGTAEDYPRFVRMMLGDGSVGGERVLRPETVADMARNHIGELRVGALKSAMPPLSNDGEFFPGVPKTFGLGFQINEEAVTTGRPAGALMWAGLANSYYWIDRATGVGGVYLTQILPFADPQSLSLYLAFETAVYDRLR